MSSKCFEYSSVTDECETAATALYKICHFFHVELFSYFLSDISQCKKVTDVQNYGGITPIFESN
jgi:hypothetical protein